jgi:hypothetical protein
MEFNLSELTLTSFNSIKLNLIEFTALNNLVAMVTMEHNPDPHFSKAHLTTFNLYNFKMIKAMGLKILHRGTLEWHYLHTKFHEDLPSDSDVIIGEHTQTKRLVM